MAAKAKILWVVHYDDLDEFHDQALEAGVTGVAIRTDNDMEAAIPRLHASGLAVYGWRWPSARRDPAMKEARQASHLLRDEGLDGYFIDPEGAPGKPWDWDQNGLSQLAADFCAEVRSGGPDKRIGLTSHYKARSIYPRLPWNEFLAVADVLLPQAYWRVAGGNVYHGDPAQNYRLAIRHWTAAGGDPARIVPMAGEIALTTSAKVRAYADEAAVQGRDELHFYTTTADVPQAVWAQIASL